MKIRLGREVQLFDGMFADDSDPIIAYIAKEFEHASLSASDFSRVIDEGAAAMREMRDGVAKLDAVNATQLATKFRSVLANAGFDDVSAGRISDEIARLMLERK